MSERFSPAEVTRLLEQAADLDNRRLTRSDSSEPADPGSFSREELERVAVEAGISLDSLRTALANREIAPPTFGERLLGGPLKASRVLVLSRVLNESELERAVSLLRAEVGSAGRLERLGGTVTWMGVVGGSTPIEAVIETRDSDTTIRLGARFDGLIGGLYGGIGGGMGGGLSYFWVSGAMALLGPQPYTVAVGLGFSLGSAFLLARTLYGKLVGRRVAIVDRLEARLRAELG